MSETQVQERFDVEAIRRRHPIEAVVGGYGIELTRSGRALVGRCPFHADGGRPNFYVYPDAGRWRCYRCDIGGDVLEFVKRREQVGFPEACRRLDGMSLQARGAPPVAQRKEPRRWDRLRLDEQIVMNAACALYRFLLWQHPKALAYVRERGIPDWVIRQCGLGYADGHSLETYLRRRFGLRQAQELGLLRRAQRGDGGRPLRELLAGRIVVPEIRQGQCLWFIGRSMEDMPDRPKYLALPGERPVLGLERAAGRREPFLCEGVFDHLSAVAMGLPSFSPCGTHLSPDRLGFLARARVVWGVLDGDEAGRAASQRFGEIIGSRWQPLWLPDGTDLNDLARTRSGRQEFRDLLAAARQERVEKEGVNGSDR